MNNRPISDYVRSVQDKASRTFNNASGAQPRAFKNNIGTPNPFNRVWQGANGGGNGGVQPVSQPMIVQIANASAAAVSINVFNAFSVLYGGYGSFVAGSLVVTNVTISTTFPNTSYQALLAQTQPQSFHVAQTRLQMISGSNSQLTNPIQWNNIDQFTGNQSSGVITFPLNDFQQLTTQVTSKTAFPMNGNTTLTLSINALTTMVIWIYPSLVVDVSNAVQGQAPVQSYSNPDINRQTIAVQQ